MKKIIAGFIILFLVIIILAPWPNRDSLIFPKNILRNYRLTNLRMTTWPAGDPILIAGYEARNIFSKIKPLSFLAIYKLEGRRANLIYRLAPVVPASVEYPRPLILEKIEVAGPFILTAWGETGADYFGTHPLVISSDKNRFQAVNFYSGNLAADPRIKNYFWTRNDFEISNFFDPANKVKTILTQGVNLNGAGQIELTFYGDNNSHAGLHREVKIILPLK